MTQALVSNPLPSWSEGPAKQAILDFVRRVSEAGGPDYVPLEERVAVFDNDGTLWCEKPMPVQADFLLRRAGEMVDADASLRERQPWKAVAEHNYRWLTGAIAKHYAGDDSDLQQMEAGLLQAYAGTTVEELEEMVTGFVQTARHPISGQPYARCVYAPMKELLRFLEDNGFTCYIVSAGGRDFMRPITQSAYGIPPERVIGSATRLAYDSGRHSIVSQTALDIFDDGPEKAVRVWSRIGRRPLLACGNSNSDIEMLDFAAGSGRRGLELVILHDDAQREFSYVTGAERAIDRATRSGWTVVSIKNDWSSVFDAG